MQTLRLLSRFAVALTACALLTSSLSVDPTPAYAQTQSKKKKVTKKKPPPVAPKEEPAVRAPFTVAESDAAVVLGIPNARAWGDSETEFARLLPQASGPWLAISGGGADGAFGAGLLSGWSQAGTRPEFAVVTGVSIGSLIAPFAFLGSKYDEELHKSFTTISAADVFEDRLTRDSLFDYWPLRRAIAERVTPKLLVDIAAEHKRGRRLLVATTSLDTGRRAVWNMGAIAERGDETALKLFRDILLASCSIPGFFSPVAIDLEANGKKLEEMHGDGTLTAPFFVVPESMIAPGGKGRPPFTQLYVLVNSKLVPDFKLPDRSIPEVLGRSIDVALTSALRAEIMLMNVGAGRHGVGLHVAHVDTSFNFPSRGPFDGRYMRALYDFGVEQGKKSSAFEEAQVSRAVRGAANPTFSEPSAPQ
ncbi:MAG: patatin-like phospholipase family protein [Xanthobacteraceae bacterium]